MRKINNHSKNRGKLFDKVNTRSHTNTKYISKLGIKKTSTL